MTNEAIIYMLGKLGIELTIEILKVAELGPITVQKLEDLYTRFGRPKQQVIDEAKARLGM